MSSPEMQRDNPFPGLRPFRSDEHHLFFGREEQTAALLQLLRQNRFLAVVGTSGSGKSSLVRAGMIAELYGGTMTHAGSAWEVLILRPGGSPIENLARAMVEADLYDAEDPSTLPRLKATLSRSRFGLVEAMKQSDVFEPGTNLLVVVDQFEELFRFRQSGVESEEAATAFVNLLLTASEQAECPIYVTITMRSDYLGDCSEIPGLAEAVNEGEYLIPRLLRDQKRDAIEKPIGVGGAKISPLLVQRLLNDVGDDPDQLPVLQHALMRMWDVWSAGNDKNRPLELADFEATGGLASALSNHADEIFDSLPDDRHRDACEKIFKTLTEKGDDNRGIRRPTRLSMLQAIAGTDRACVTTVLDAFRGSGVTFLMPGMEVELTDRTVLDLSHESLMRGWQRLRTWVEDEAQSARIFRRVLDTARLWSDGKAGLFRDPDLQIALSWREEEQPNAQWAAQYGGHFKTAIDFLETSNADAEAERQAKEAARQRELQQAQQLVEAERQRATDQARAAVRLRWLVRGLGVVAVVALLATVVAWFARQEARSNADVAARKAVDAEQQREIAQNALVDVAAAKELAERNLKTAEVAQATAIEAERRSREFRYATDMQLAATLVADETANAGQILTRLADHDPEANQELEGKDDLRGFEWHYLKRLVEGRATVIEGFEKEVAAAAVNSAGELVTLTKAGLLQRWDLVTRQEAGPALDVTKGRSPSSGALAPDGRQIALGVGDKVYLVDATTGEENRRTIAAMSRCGLVFSPDSKMLITVDTGIGWWDTSTGNPIAIDDFKLTAYGAGYHPLSVSADGLTVAVGGQGSYRGSFSVFQLNPETRAITRLVDTAGGSGTKRALAISPDGQTVAVSLYFAGAIYLFDTSTGKPLRASASAHPASISAIAFDPEGTRMVTAAMDGSVKVWEDYKQIDTTDSTALVGHAEQVDTLAWTADGKQLLSAGKDNSVRLWNLEQDGDSIHRTIADALGFRARYSPDGTLMAVAGEKDAIQLRDVETGQTVTRLPRDGEELGSDSLVFSPDNRLLATGFGGKNGVSFIELWDIDRRERLAVLPGSTEIPGFTTTESTGLVSGLTFSSDGKHLVAGFGSLQLLSGGDQGNHPLLVYEVAGRRVIRRLEGHRNACISVAFSKDNSRLASASYDGTARIWDTASWQELHVLENPDTATDRGQRRVTDVAFTPDGKLLAMASAEGNVIIWDAETGQHLKTLRGHSNEVWSVVFSPSGRTLASGSWDGTIRLWNVATWRELARLEPGEDFGAMSLAFSPDGSRLLAAGGNAVFWSVKPEGVDPVLAPQQLSTWLEPGFDLASRVRMLSEHPQLHEALEKLSLQHPDNLPVQAALAATGANWHASQKEWDQAAEQFARLKELSPKATDAWMRTPGLLRLATALLHQDRPADAAQLLTGGEQRRGEDGNGTRSVSFGIQFGSEYPKRLHHVSRGSPAWQAGLREGDIILKFNDVELIAETIAEMSRLAASGAETVLTVQHPGQDQPQTVELTGASHIQDDASVELIETLLAAVDQKIAESPNQPGLLELRAELAGQSSEYEQQVADYTAAIAALSERPSDEVAVDLARLYRRRGNVYVALKQWQPALDDYAKGITDETTDEDLLINQALAQAEVLLDALSGWKTLEPVQMKSEGGATLTLQEDGSILASGENPDRDVYTLVVRSELKQISGIMLEAIPDPSLPGNGSGRGITGNGNFHLNELMVFSADGAVTLTNAIASFQESNPQGDEAWHAIDGTVDARRGWSVNGRQSQHNTLTASLNLNRAVDDELKIELHFSTAKWMKHNLGRFRLSVTDNPEQVPDSQALLAARKLTDPWQKLAAAYRINDDQQAIDQLVERHPQTTGAIGDLFIAGEVKDWQRACEIYSKGITPESTDKELLARRAKAYEELNDWNAAAADWSRVAKENPASAKLLADFASRLVSAGQNDLAAAQRQRARQILEVTLQVDPGDNLAVDRLAALLLESIEPKWTVLKSAEMKSLPGTILTLEADQKMLTQRGNPDAKFESLVMQSGDALMRAVRVDETGRIPASADASSFFDEYQIAAIGSMSKDSGAMRGQYVRIDLPGKNDRYPRHPSHGDKKVLSLGEVEVFQGNENVAIAGNATQSTTDVGGVAKRAIDGNTNGNWSNNTTTHTAEETGVNGPWWEVDLGGEKEIDRMVIWNRPEIPERLRHFRIMILDASRKIVFEQFVVTPPQPSLEVSLTSIAAPPVGADTDSPGDLRLAVRLVGNRLNAMNIADSRLRLAAAYDLNSEAAASANWFDRALDEAETDKKREPILTQLRDRPEPLAELLERRPDDTNLQLALAKSHVDRGQLELSRDNPESALVAFQQARDAFTRLRSQYPEPDWTVLKPIEMTTQTSAQLLLQDDDSLLVHEPDGNDTFSVAFETTLNGITGLRLETLADPRLPGGGPGTNGDGNFVLSEISLQVAPLDHSNPARTICLVNAAADFSQDNSDNDVSNSIDGLGLTGWAIYPQTKQDHVAVFETAEKIGDGQPLRLTVRLAHQTITEQLLVGRFRVSVTTDSVPATTSKLRFHLTHSELAALDVSVGKALAHQDKSNEAAIAFARALDRVEEDEDRKPLIEQFQEHRAALTILAQQRPQDSALQLALAKSLAESGKKALADKRQDEALPQLAKARELFASLAAEQPDSEWTVLEPTELTSDGGADLTLEADGSIFVSGENPAVDTYDLSVLLAGGGMTAVRLETIPDARFEPKSAGRNRGEFLVSEIEVVLEGPDGTRRPLTFSGAYADFSAGGQFVSNVIDANESTYWGVKPQLSEPHLAVFTLAEPLALDDAAQRMRIRLKCGNSSWSGLNLGRFRLSVTSSSNPIEVATFQQELKASGLADLQISLGDAHGRQAQVDDSATAFSEALDLATDREARTKILQAASAYDGVLDKLTELRSADAAFLDILARHHQANGDFAAARAAAATARTLYEEKLAGEPANSKLAKDLADLLIDVHPVEWTVLKPLDMSSEGNATFTAQQDGSVLMSGANTAGDVYTLTGNSDVGVVNAVRLEVLPDESLPANGPGRHESGNFHLKSFELFTPPVDGMEQSPIAMSGVTASFAYSADDADVAGTIDDTSNKVWHIWGQTGKKQQADFVLSSSLHIEPGAPLTIVLKHSKDHAGINLGRFRLSVAAEFLAPEFQKNLDAAAKLASTWSRLGAAYLAHGQFDIALDMFARSIELAGTDQAKAAAAQEAAAFPDIFAKLQERFPDDRALRLGQAKYLAAQHIAESQFQAAVDGLSGVLADFPNDIELLNQRADAHTKLAQWQAADADYARVLEIEIDDARRRAAERSRAQVQLRLGQFQAGADVYLRETLLSPGDYWRLRDACTTLMLTGQPGIEKVVAGRFYDKFNGTKDANQANWLVRAFTVQPGLVTRANSRKLLELAETAGGTWTAPMTAAIHYRLGDLKQAEPLLTSSKGKPMFEALAAMLLYDQGKTDEARTFLKAGPEAWIERERAKDRGSAIPAQQSWQEWGVRVAAWREAARKLMGPRITELDQLLAIDPDKTAELLERAGLLADAGLYDEALKDLNRLVALNVDSPESLALHGRLLAGLNRDDEALPYLNQAIEGGSQDGGVYVARGAILLRQGHAEPARADLEKSLELAPTELAARSLSNLLLTEAEQATTWTVLKPTEMKSEGGVTLTLLEDDSVLSSGKHPKRDVYTVTVPLPVRNVTSIALEMLPHPSFVGGSVGRASNGRAAITELEVAGLVQSGEQQTVRLSAAIADFEQQDPGRLWSAASVIDGNTDKPSWGVAPNLQEPHRLIVKLDQPTADDTVALRIVIRQNHFHDKLVDGLLLGRFRLLVTDDPPAFEHEKYRYAALKLTDPWARLAGAYLALGNQVALDKLLTRHPAVAVGIADLFAAARDWQRAIAQYSKSITPETIDADLLAKRADAYLACEQWELADADWNRIFELNPSDQPLRQRWVTALTAAKRWPQLGEYYNEVFEGLPEGRASYQPRYKQIETLIRRKDGVFDALRSIRPNDSLLQISLARDAVLRADWDEAVAAYPPGIDDAATPDERYECAAALLLAGHNDQYREFLHRIVEQENSNAENALDAYSLARMATISPEENVDWSQVIQWGETAAKEDTGWYTHVAGLAQLRGGHFDEAIQWLDKSIASGWHPELNQLGLCLLHAKKGNREKAREYLTKAQEWLKNTESKQVDGYYKVQATDWLEFNVLIQESEALLDGDPE